ncbi:hypothetical protein SAMN02745148_02181 [Modicisalibacter ilicicola DSM 19980]|uniref:Uncharacterized protein n=1 Tax=Modicisalibacter ilicicola DSM 19980 TaxID=1121942 RepID=A0A1M5AA57_9GAMM|nr:hypothetical protein [Halomonas ilicicola]SHF27143.1 hypothetical protein SAMN02745148_02181 [Halomonas ilicicola DSM 19980]
MTTQRQSPRMPRQGAREESFIEHVQGPGIVHQMAHLEPEALAALISDLTTPLNGTFEKAVEDILTQGGLEHFAASRTLLPAMLERFGLAEDDLAMHAECLETAREACDTCPAVGRCWRALRHGAGREECRGFCPSAEAFVSRAASSSG